MNVPARGGVNQTFSVPPAGMGFVVCRDVAAPAGDAVVVAFQLDPVPVDGRLGVGLVHQRERHRLALLQHERRAGVRRRRVAVAERRGRSGRLLRIGDRESEPGVRRRTGSAGVSIVIVSGRATCAA